MFPETRDNSHPRATPVTSPAAVNLNMSFVNGYMVGFFDDAAREHLFQCSRHP
jgi:hypothetical protein